MPKTSSLSITKLPSHTMIEPLVLPIASTTYLQVSPPNRLTPTITTIPQATPSTILSLQNEFPQSIFSMEQNPFPLCKKCLVKNGNILHPKPSFLSRDAYFLPTYHRYLPTTSHVFPQEIPLQSNYLFYGTKPISILQELPC